MYLDDFELLPENPAVLTSALGVVSLNTVFWTSSHFSYLNKIISYQCLQIEHGRIFDLKAMIFFLNERSITYGMPSIRNDSMKK